MMAVQSGFLASRPKTPVRLSRRSTVEKTELYGAVHVGASGDEPRFVTEGASFSAAGVYGGFKNFAKETRDNMTKIAPHSKNSDIYTAFSAKTNPNEFVVDTEDKVGVELQGDWKTDTGFLGGWHGANSLHDENSNKGKMSASFLFELSESGQYELAMKWPPQRSGFQHADNVPMAIQSIDGNEVDRNIYC